MSVIGIDITTIKRFRHWHLYNKKILSKIFSPEEIDYCLSFKLKSAERFAIRFAAKEACYKALCQINPKISKIPFFTFLKNVSVSHLKNSRIPILKLAPKFFDQESFEINLALTHEKNYAVACVFIN